MWDTDGNGSTTVAELIGNNPSLANVMPALEKYFGIADAKGDKKVTKGELAAFLRANQISLKDMEDVMTREHAPMLAELEGPKAKKAVVKKVVKKVKKVRLVGKRLRQKCRNVRNRKWLRLARKALKLAGIDGHFVTKA